MTWIPRKKPACARLCSVAADQVSNRHQILVIHRPDHSARGGRDVDSGRASGQMLGTPTLFMGGAVHRGGYDPPTLLAALAS